MRRRASLLAAVLALAALLPAGLGVLRGGRDGGATAQAAGGKALIDVVFDNAKGVIPGQQVKIAGAKVGLIHDVTLTPDFKARVTIEVDRRFTPFRTDARCSLKPEGLISERFVECDPGTPSAPELRGVGDARPTVPVSHTSLPVSLTDLFRVLDVPSSERLTLLLSGLGIGVSGRGQDINAILLRSNPALQQVRRVLATIARQRGELRTAVRATDRVISALARNRGDLRAFVRHAARSGSRLAARRDDLSEAVRRLPGTLAAARPALRRLDATSAALAPVLDDVRAAAPSLDRALTRLPAVARAATPSLTHLGAAAQRGQRAVKSARPVVDLLATFSAKALPVGEDLNRALVSLRDSGTLDGLLRFFYSAGAELALHDDVSHIGPSLFSSALCLVDLKGPSCVSEGERTGGGTARRRKAKAPAAKPPAAAAPSQPQTQQQPPAAGPARPTIKVPGLPPITLPGPPQQRSGDDAGQPVKRLLDYLLK